MSTKEIAVGNYVQLDDWKVGDPIYIDENNEITLGIDS